MMSRTKINVAIAIIVAAILSIFCIWKNEIATIGTISEIGDNEYLYQIEYKADYDLDEAVAANLDSNSALLQYVAGKIGKGIISIKTTMKDQTLFTEAEHCTSFQAKSKDTDGYYYGRNYDFFKNPAMVTFSHPKNGYASISMVDLYHLGLSLNKLPDTFKNKILCLAAIYVPMDGINEKGLCTSIMALPKQPAYQDTGKNKVGTSLLMRLFLDKCASVDEALELVSKLDICHDQGAGSGYHYMVADAMGNCAVIEFDKEDGYKTMVVRKSSDKNSMHVTNHLLSGKYYTTEPDPAVGNPHSKSWWRYEKVGKYLSDRDGCLLLDEADECLGLVHWKDLVWDNGMVEDTQWSALYDQSEITLHLRMWNQYESTYEFKL